MSGPAPLHILRAAILLRNLLKGKIHYKYNLIQQSETFLEHIENIRVDNVCPAIWLQSFLKYSWTLQGNAFCLIGSIYLAESYKVECGTYCEAQLLQLVLDVHLRMENFHVNSIFIQDCHLSVLLNSRCAYCLVDDCAEVLLHSLALLTLQKFMYLNFE